MAIDPSIRSLYCSMTRIVSWASAQVSRGMAEDEEDVGDDVELLAPSDEVVEVAHLDLLADDLVADPVRAGFEAEGQMEEPGLLHLGEERPGS